MTCRSLLFLVVLALYACAEEQALSSRSGLSPQFPPFEEVSLPTANMVAEVSDSGRFELSGTLEIEEVEDSLVPRIDIALSGFGRNGEGIGSFSLGVPLDSDGRKFAELQRGMTAHSKPIAWVKYPKGATSISRPVVGIQLQLQENQGIRVELSLGRAVDVFAGKVLEGDDSATALVQGRLGISCMVHEHPSREYKDPMGAKRMLSRIADPSYRTQFCRDAIDTLGIRDFLDFPPEGPVVAHPTEATAPPTTMPDGTLRPTDWQTTTPTAPGTTDPTVEPVAVIDAGVPSKLTK